MFIGSSCRARTTVEIDCYLFARYLQCKRVPGEPGAKFQEVKTCRATKDAYRMFARALCVGKAEIVCAQHPCYARSSNVISYYLPPHPPICKHAAYPKTSKTPGLFSLCWQKHKQVYTYIGKGQSETCGNLQKREASGIAETACKTEV